MPIYENLTYINGMRVVDFRRPGDIQDFAGIAPRVRCEWEDPNSIADYLSVLLQEPGVEAVKGLVIGLWLQDGESFEATPDEGVELLVAQKNGLPELQALFVGDIISEENEISWITQGSMSALWAAFPQLQNFTARGGNGLRLGKINHALLRSLVIETGGLAAPVLREALEADAPLEHLELWPGSEDYGGNSSVADFADLLDGRLFPKLKRLGLRNCEYTDDLAAALADSAIMERIEILDLSLGTLSDRGAAHLVQSGKLAGLHSLDVTHHYLSDAMVAKLRDATPNLIAEDPQEPDSWNGEDHYYIAVSE